jgi:zinc transport system substrate-binding protein
MKIQRMIIVALLIFSSFVLTACNSDIDSDTEKIQISVSILPQKTFVEAVAKDKVEINVVIPPGSSPSTYEPTPQESTRLENTDIYFAVGVPTEAANILPLIDENKTKLISLHELIIEDYPDIIIGGKRDPHIWLSPKRVAKMIEIIRDELIFLDNKNATFYTENAAIYIEELEQLNDYALTKLANIENNKFIVFHPAFRYLAQDFGLEMYALEQDGKEATPQRIAEMIEVAKAEGIKVIFYQAEFSSTQAQSFAEEIGGQTMMLAPLSPNYITNLQTMIDLLHQVMTQNES